MTQGHLFPDHAGQLHRERRVDRRGRTQTRWVRAADRRITYFVATGSSLKGRDPTLGVMVNASIRGIPRGVKEGRRFGMDNGAYTGQFNPTKLLKALDTFHPYRAQCKFVVSPDTLMDGAATEAQLETWRPVIRQAGYKVAFVAHRGTTALPDCDVLFVPAMNLDDPNIPRLVAEARRAGKWVHVGRVNSAVRTESMWRLGADSVDGTHTRFEGLEQGVANITSWTQSANAQATLPELLQEARHLEDPRALAERKRASQSRDEAAVHGALPLDRLHPDDIYTGMIVGVRGDPRPGLLMTEPDEDGHVVVHHAAQSGDPDEESDPEIYHMADVHGPVELDHQPNRIQKLTARQMAGVK